MKKSILFFIVAMVIPGSVEALCHKAQVCDDYGMNCQVQDICDSSIDIPSIGVAPIQPLPSTEIKPLPSVGVPPIGTTRCEYKQVNGNWQNVCR